MKSTNNLHKDFARFNERAPMCHALFGGIITTCSHCLKPMPHRGAAKQYCSERCYAKKD